MTHKQKSFFKNDWEARNLMNYQNTCDFNVGSYPTQSTCCPKTSRSQKFIKPFLSFIISVMLAISMTHLCEKYSSNNSFNAIKSDLNTLRNNLNFLTSEVKVLIRSRNEFENNLKKNTYEICKLSKSISELRNEVSEEAVTMDNVKDLVRTELQIYDADKTGRTDYALESSGGSIISTRDTETYSHGEPIMSLFGIPLCKQQNIPRIIIQTGARPGECWAFKGSRGAVVIKLLGYVRITGVTLEHIPSTIAPNSDISSAPKGFSISGLNDENDEQGYLLGSYMYDNSGPPIQYFEVENENNRAYDIVELKIHSNNGNSNYTCIYRVRVHGDLTVK